jgi:hypothetical protein
MKRITTIALHSVFLVALVFSTGYTLAQKETQEKHQTEKKQVLAQLVPRPLPSDVQKETQEKQQTEKKQVPTQSVPRPLPSDVQKETQEKQQTEKKQVPTQSVPRPLPSDVQKETQEKQQTEKKQVPIQSIPRPLPDMTRRLQEANKAFRDAVASEMQAAARQAGVKIRTDNFIAIPFDDSGTVIVNSMIEGADRVSIEQLAKGADVLFIYSGAKLGFAGREIDPGFYVVRISRNPASGQWIAKFKNLQGRVVLETEAIVEKPDSNAAKMQPMCTLGPKGELILFDEHDRFKNITLSVSSKITPSLYENSILTAKLQTLREAAWQVVKKVAKEPVSIEQVVPVSLGPVPLPDAIVVLFNCGTEKKPDWCECETVERGPVYLVVSCIGQESKKWYVFYVLR